MSFRQRAIQTVALPPQHGAVACRVAGLGLGRTAGAVSGRMTGEKTHRHVATTTARHVPYIQNHTRRLACRPEGRVINTRAARRGYAEEAGGEEMVVQTPAMADSITQGTLGSWEKDIGDYVERDEVVANIETDKISVPVNAPASGTLIKVFAQEDDTVEVGGDLFVLRLGEEKPVATESASPPATEAAPAKEEGSMLGSLVSKIMGGDDVAPKVAATPTPAPAAPKADAVPAAASTSGQAMSFTGYPRPERRVKMNRMRSRIAERLKESQNTAASLTTFNECDMSQLIQLRATYKDAILKKHDVKFGFMSAFVAAATAALQEVPAVNARIDGPDLVYHDFVDMSVAVATPKGLVTPVIRNCERLSMLDVEREIASLGARARDGALSLEDMTGGTFTISNGGVFGSLMGTPILNTPQAGILGMHATKDRAVVVNGKVEVRPMMYLALTYDHRIIDGREAVTFLKRVKEFIEDPRRLLIDI